MKTYTNEELKEQLLKSGYKDTEDNILNLRNLSEVYNEPLGVLIARNMHDFEDLD